MRVRSQLPRLLVGAGVLVIASAACGGGKQRAGERATTARSEWRFHVEAGATRLVAPPPPPRVTREATKIASRDPSLRQLVDGSALRISKSGNWTSIDDGRRLGANLIVRLRHPIAVNADLPYVVIPPDTTAGQACPHPYARGWLHERSTNVDELGVLVDVHRRAVVAIDTNARSGVRSWVPGRLHPRCPA